MIVISESNAHQLFAIPKGYNAWVSMVLVLLCLIIFLIVYGCTSFLSDYLPWRFKLSFAFENAIPFVPLASVIYLSMTFLLGFAPFILRYQDEIIPFFWVLIAEIVIGGVFFIVLPIDTSFPERAAQGVSGLVFDLANFVNMKRNYFPSLHVCFAFTAAFFYSTKANLFATVFFYIWALAISASTILIHEHYLIDVLAGFLLALISWKVVGSWVVKNGVVWASKTMLKQFYDLIHS